MKKIIILSLIIGMLVLSGCGNSKNNANSENKEIPLPTSEKKEPDNTSNNTSDKNEPSDNTSVSNESKAEETLKGVTTEKIEKMADEINAAKEAGDIEKERQLLDEVQKYLEAMEELAPENQQ